MSTVIQVENYRAFSTKTRFELRPLTLLFGYNSAGKSALLRLLPLIRDSIEQRDSAINMRSACMRGASFPDILSKQNSSQSFKFSVEVDANKVDVSVRNLPERRNQVVERLAVTRNGELTALDWCADPKSFPKYTLTSKSKKSEEDVTFSGLFVDSEGTSSPTAVGLSIFAQELLSSQFGHVHWLQALRAVPPRKEVVSEVSKRLSPDGSGITQLLFDHETRGSDIMEDVSKWYKEATGFPLHIERGAFSGREIISFRLLANNQQIELADTGEGIGQVLPIVGLLQLARKKLLGSKPLLAFEHPELHLHAAAEPALADLLCEVAGAGAATIVAETHSESFLLALQLAIIEGRLKAEDVAVYWVRQPTNESANLTLIDFDDAGLPAEGAWPVGVFSEKADKARKVVLARRKRANHES